MAAWNKIEGALFVVEVEVNVVVGGVNSGVHVSVLDAVIEINIVVAVVAGFVAVVCDVKASWLETFPKLHSSVKQTHISSSSYILHPSFWISFLVQQLLDVPVAPAFVTLTQPSPLQSISNLSVLSPLK